MTPVKTKLLAETSVIDLVTLFCAVEQTFNYWSTSCFAINGTHTLVMASTQATPYSHPPSPVCTFINSFVLNPGWVGFILSRKEKQGVLGVNSPISLFKHTSIVPAYA